MLAEILKSETYFKASNLLFKIDQFCDCRIWNEGGKNEKTYRSLKAAVRAFNYALQAGYISEQGDILMPNANEVIDMARNPDYVRYMEEDKYRANVNIGKRLIEIEEGLNINILQAAEQIYNIYKNQRVDVEQESATRNYNYSELIFRDKYEEG